MAASSTPRQDSSSDTSSPSGGLSSLEIVKQGRLTIEPTRISASGFKTAQVSHIGGKLQWQTPWVRVPFHPRKFQEDSSDKVSLALCCDEGDVLLRLGEALDDWALSMARLNSMALFGRILSPTEIVKSYQPLLRKSEDRRPLLKSKIWVSGSQQARAWDESGTRRTFPTNLRNYEMRASQVLKGLWFHTGNKCGIALETADLQVRPREDEGTRCPFS